MEANNNTDQVPQLKGQYHISNAGIVLLHPFLPAFAAAINLTTENGDFKNDCSRGRLVYLLQYLATGNELVTETDLALNNILCGIPPDTKVRYDMVVTGDEKEQAESLLTAVIGHWRALKNTSIDGLREAFLLREGLIITTGDPVTLTIGNRSWDILLKDIPWNNSVIKTPWMPHILHVDW